jgi:hypothetical protein
MPGDAGVTVVTMLVCLFFIAYEAAGASRARHSLRPLTKRVRKVLANLGRIRPRDREGVSVNDGCCLKFESVPHPAAVIIREGG